MIFIPSFQNIFVVLTILKYLLFSPAGKYVCLSYGENFQHYANSFVHNNKILISEAIRLFSEKLKFQNTISM